MVRWLKVNETKMKNGYKAAPELSLGRQSRNLAILDRWMQLPCSTLGPPVRLRHLSRVPALRVGNVLFTMLVGIFYDSSVVAEYVRVIGPSSA